MSLYLGSVSVVNSAVNQSVNINDSSGNALTSAMGNLNVAVSGNNYNNDNLKIVSAAGFTTTKVWDLNSLNPDDVSQPVGSTYAVSNCTVYGNASGACVLALQFSVDNGDYYTSQYTTTLTGAQDFGFCVPGCSAPTIRLIVISGTPTVTAYISLA
jgi:hypothetical protein